MKNPEELFEKLMNNEITREEFESLLEGLDDENIRARYDDYLEARFMEEVESHASESGHELEDDVEDIEKDELNKKLDKKTRAKFSLCPYPVAAVVFQFLGVAFAIFYKHLETIDYAIFEESTESVRSKMWLLQGTGKLW